MDKRRRRERGSRSRGRCLSESQSRISREERSADLRRHNERRKAEIDYSIVMRKRLRIMGTSLRTRSLEEKATATRLFAEHVVPLLASGSVRPVVDSVFKMDEVREAHQRIESNETFGKVILTID